MKAYKGFKKDMTCRGFQFEEGKAYHADTAVLCHCGFHACLDPLDCLGYYDPCDSVYHEVEIDNVSEQREDDTKVVAKDIKIGSRISIKDIVKESIDFTFSNVQKENNTDCASGNFSSQAASGYSSSQAASGYYSRQAASGNSSSQAASGNSRSQAASGYSSSQAASGNSSSQAASGHSSRQAASGYYSRQAASGYYSRQASSGNFSSQAASGNSSRQAASGNSSSQAASGYSSRQAASGYSSRQAASGNSSRQAASGDYSSQETTGKNCVMMSAGNEGQAKGKIGSWIVLTEWKSRGNESIPTVVAKRIDGTEVKEDTWYTLKNGEFVEVEE